MIPPAAGFVHRYEPGRGDRRTLLALHGTGGDENDLIEVARALAPRAAVLSPRGPVLENGAPRFFRRLAAGVFDEADVAARARDLARFVRESADQRGFDPARVVAVGYSNGANIAAAVMLLEPLTLLGGVLFRAMPPLTPGSPPTSRTSRCISPPGGAIPTASTPRRSRSCWRATARAWTSRGPTPGTS